MTLTRRDAVPTGLVGLAVLAFLATHEAWNVPLIGDNRHWAAAVILVLGIGACSAGARRTDSLLFSLLGGTAFALGVVAIVTGSLTPLSLLVADILLMWVVATARHGHVPPGKSVAT